jgi:hypothetical protein
MKDHVIYFDSTITSNLQINDNAHSMTSKGSTVNLNRSDIALPKVKVPKGMTRDRFRNSDLRQEVANQVRFNSQLNKSAQKRSILNGLNDIEKSDIDKSYDNLPLRNQSLSPKVFN